MLTRYWDRRRFIRVPASGPVRWRSGGRAGDGELLDISPGGAGLRISARRASQLGPELALEIEVGPDERWALAENARVVRQVPDANGMCRVGVEFAQIPA